MDVYEYVGSQIRKLREDYQLSQDALAKELGVSTNTISRWETATYKLSIKDLEKIASYFKVKLSSLLPPEEKNSSIQTALLSATGDLADDDIQELINYAEYRRARKILEEGKSKRK